MYIRERAHTPLYTHTSFSSPSLWICTRVILRVFATVACEYVCMCACEVWVGFFFEDDIRMGPI